MEEGYAISLLVVCFLSFETRSVLFRVFAFSVVASAPGIAAGEAGGLAGHVTWR
jgi:hypothetical protein